MRRGSTVLRRMAIALVVPALLFAARRPAVAQEREEWDVTIAARLSDGSGKPVTLHIALPREDPYQQMSDLDVVARGMQTDIVKGDHPEVVLRGPLGKGKRVSVSYRVRLFRYARTPARVLPTADPPVEAIDAIGPAPLFPSRSILVREFLETQVAPRLEGKPDLLSAIYRVTRKKLNEAKAGASLPLDVLRSGEGKRLGIERCFTTFLRCAHFPARFVEGIKLDSSTRRKRVFWTEVWSDGDWWPLSASGGWRGRRPASYLALARDGRRVLKLEGDGEASYVIHTEPLDGAPSGKGKQPR